MGKHRSALFVAFMLIGAAAAEVPAEKAAEAAREEGTALRGATDSRRLAITRPLQLDFPVISRVDQGDYTRFWVPGTLNAIPVKVEVRAMCAAKSALSRRRRRMILAALLPFQHEMGMHRLDMIVLCCRGGRQHAVWLPGAALDLSPLQSRADPPATLTNAGVLRLPGQRS